MTPELIPNWQDASNRSISSLVQILYKDLAGWFSWAVELEVLSFILSILHLLTQSQSTTFLSYCSYGYNVTTHLKSPIGSIYIHDTYKYLLAFQRFPFPKRKARFHNAIEALGQGRLLASICQGLDSKGAEGCCRRLMDIRTGFSVYRNLLST